MKVLNNKIIVEFDKNHNEVVGKGLNGLDIIRGHAWATVSDDEEMAKKYTVNTNYREVHPQICTVLHPSSNHDYKVGDKLFVHYMAAETCEYVGYLGITGYIIETDFIFFQILEDGIFKMVDGLYLGEQQYTAEEIRPSGIFIGGGVKEGLKVRITHIPEKFPKWYKEHPINIGDLVLTIDDKQYELDYWGKKYIKLVDSEIVGTFDISAPVGLRLLGA